jgi:hypothetical protein
LNSSSSRPPLRIGLLLNGNVQPAWVAEVLEQIVQSNFACVQLVVYRAPLGVKQSFLRRAAGALVDKKSRSELLFRLYARWDKLRVRGRDDPFRKTDCGDSLNNIETMQVAPLSRGPVDRFPSEAIDRIRSMDLDVLIRFGFNILRGEVLEAARYGVWSYHHGDNEFYRGGPPCFWELVEGNPITGAMLQVLTEDLDAGRVLIKGWFRTHPSGSWLRNRMQPYWGASTFVTQKLRQVHELGWEWVEKEIVPAAAYQGKRGIYSTPTNGEMARWLVRKLARAAVEAATWLPRRLCIDHWRLAVHRGQRTRLTEGNSGEIGKFRWVPSPRGHFCADPFLFCHSGRQWLFFEDFDYGAHHGSIAAAEVLAEGALSPAMRVLDRPYHLSYPCVFEVGGEVYMIPESREHGTVEMYRSTKFPDEWELAREFLEVSAVDTTVWTEGGVYWFFVTLRERRGGGLQLWLFSSRGILEDWQPHPANPISTDIRSSRGGGAIFREGELLMRPSQDCSGNYGRSFTLNEILVLNEREYRERPHETVEAPHGMMGTHTYGRLEDVEVIDGCAWRSIFEVYGSRSFSRRLWRKLGLMR